MKKIEARRLSDLQTDKEYRITIVEAYKHFRDKVIPFDVAYKFSTRIRYDADMAEWLWQSDEDWAPLINYFFVKPENYTSVWVDCLDGKSVVYIIRGEQ